MNKLILIIMMIGLAPNVYAGDKGNGGDVTMCFNSEAVATKVKLRILSNKGKTIYDKVDPLNGMLDKISSVELFDLYEGQGELFPTEVITSNDKYIEIVKERIEQIRQKSSLYLKLNKAMKMLKKYSTSSPAGTIEIDDSKHEVILPSHCLLLQLGQQTKKNFVYNNTIFKLLSEESKAAFLVHELLFYVAINNYQRKEERSPSIRRATRMIFDKDFESMNNAEFNQFLLEDLLFSSGTYSGDIMYEQNIVTLEINNKEADGFIPLRSYNRAFYLNENTSFLMSNKEVEFKEGLIAISHNFPRKILKGHMKESHTFNNIKFKAGETTFHYNGEIWKGVLADVTKINGFYFKEDLEVSFNNEGKLAGEYTISGTVSANSKYQLVRGSKVNYNDKGELVFIKPINETTLNGVRLEAGSAITFYPASGKISSFQLKENTVISGIELKEKTYVHFYENGDLKKFTALKPFIINKMNCSDLLEISFYENNKLKSCVLETPLKLKGLFLNGRVRLYKNGMIKEANLDENKERDSFIETKNDKIYYHIYKGYKLATLNGDRAATLKLYEDGSIKSTYLAVTYKLGNTYCEGNVYGKSFFGTWQHLRTYADISKISFYEDGKLEECFNRTAY